MHVHYACTCTLLPEVCVLLYVKRVLASTACSVDERAWLLLYFASHCSRVVNGHILPSDLFNDHLNRYM